MRSAPGPPWKVVAISPRRSAPPAQAGLAEQDTESVPQARSICGAAHPRV